MEELIAGTLIVLLLGVVGRIFSGPGKQKKSTADARFEREHGYNDWIVRGGTNEGWNLQNTPIRNPQSSWKPGVRIVGDE